MGKKIGDQIFENENKIQRKFFDIYNKIKSIQKFKNKIKLKTKFSYQKLKWAQNLLNKKKLWPKTKLKIKFFKLQKIDDKILMWK